MSVGVGQVHKRYSDFDALREELHRLAKSDSQSAGPTLSTNFPEKHIFRSNSSSVVEERKEGFHAWLQQAVLPHVVLPVVADFLELEKHLQHTAPPAAAATPVSEDTVDFYSPRGTVFMEIDGIDDSPSARSPFIEPLHLDLDTAAVNSSCVNVEGAGSVAHLFYLLDSDGNKSLDIQELTVVHGSEKQLKDFFSLWDTDQNNTIDLDEFLLYFVDLFQRKGGKTVSVVIKNWFKRAAQLQELEQDIQRVTAESVPDTAAAALCTESSEQSPTVSGCPSEDANLIPEHPSPPQANSTSAATNEPDYSEGASTGKGVAPNGCGWERPSATAREEEKEIYHASMVTADTMYCHHFNDAGEHLVLHGLPSSDARHCCGVIYMSVGWSGKKLVCKAQRRPKQEGKDAGHDKCDAKKCPFLAEGLSCPYMPLGFTPKQ